MMSDRKKLTWWQKLLRFHPSAHYVRPVPEGRNMPRYQPCPECHRGAKRIGRDMTGALYECKPCHQSFFVKGA